jgi:hypothetical protein
LLLNANSAISWREQVNFQKDDDDVRFVLDQHAELDFYSAISLVKVGVLASSAVDHGFEFRSGQPKAYKIGMCCFSAKHA